MSSTLPVRRRREYGCSPPSSPLGNTRWHLSSDSESKKDALRSQSGGSRARVARAMSSRAVVARPRKAPARVRSRGSRDPPSSSPLRSKGTGAHVRQEKATHQNRPRKLNCKPRLGLPPTGGDGTQHVHWTTAKGLCFASGKPSIQSVLHRVFRDMPHLGATSRIRLSGQVGEHDLIDSRGPTFFSNRIGTFAENESPRGGRGGRDEARERVEDSKRLQQRIGHSGAWKKH